MSLIEKINEEAIRALKATKSADSVEAVEYLKIRTNVLRAVKTEVTKAETSGKSRSELNNDGVIAVIRKMIKQRDETAEEYARLGAVDKQTKELTEAHILTEFVPAQLDEEHTRILVKGIIDEQGLEGQRAIGRVMGAIKGRTDIDGGLASKIARELLG